MMKNEDGIVVENRIYKKGIVNSFFVFMNIT
jgi:hypothetical protein